MSLRTRVAAIEARLGEHDRDFDKELDPRVAGCALDVVSACWDRGEPKSVWGPKLAAVVDRLGKALKAGDDVLTATIEAVMAENGVEAEG